MEVENQSSILETKQIFQCLYVSRNHPKMTKHKSHKIIRFTFEHSTHSKMIDSPISSTFPVDFKIRNLPELEAYLIESFWGHFGARRWAWTRSMDKNGCRFLGFGKGDSSQESNRKVWSSLPVLFAGIIFRPTWKDWTVLRLLDHLTIFLRMSNRKIFCYGVKISSISWNHHLEDFNFTIIWKVGHGWRDIGKMAESPSKKQNLKSPPDHQLVGVLHLISYLF